MGELILMNLCRPALGVQFFETPFSVAAEVTQQEPSVNTTIIIMKKKHMKIDSNHYFLISICQQMVQCFYVLKKEILILLFSPVVDSFKPAVHLYTVNL